jgi:hypothetical protein
MLCRSLWVMTTILAATLSVPGTAGAVARGSEGPIAFLRSQVRAQSELWVANPDGSKAGVLVRGQAVSPFAWSPDGRRLAYLDGGDLWIATVRDGRRSLAIRDFRYSSEGSWSPDGSRFAGLNGRAAVAVVGIDGTGEVELAQRPNPPYGSNRSPDWSPDGARIVYVRHYGADQSKGIPEIHVVAANGSGDQVTTSAGFGGEFTSSSWSPDGTQIAVIARGSTDLTSHIELMAPDGSARVRLAGSDGAFDAVWSPSGSRLAFIRDGQLWTSGRDGGGVAPTGLAADAGSVVWGAGPLLTRKVAAPGAGLGAGALRGSVGVKRRGARRFTRLRDGQTVPFGAELDTRRGTVRIFGGGNAVIVRGGVFRVMRRKGALAELRLSARGCKRRLTVRDADGRVGVRGRRSATLGDGARWIVEDRCNGTTTTRVQSGTVQVRDVGRRRTVRVGAGGRHVARR